MNGNKECYIAPNIIIINRCIASRWATQWCEQGDSGLAGHWAALHATYANVWVGPSSPADLTALQVIYAITVGLG